MMGSRRDKGPYEDQGQKYDENHDDILTWGMRHVKQNSRFENIVEKEGGTSYTYPKKEGFVMRRYRNTAVVISLALLVFSVVGCDTMGENTKRGAVGGAVVGSIAGGVIGHQMGRGIEGALVGGTVGALGGGLVGSSIDQKRTKEEIVAGKEKLGISDVIVLAKSGMTDDAIIAKIAETGSVYNLSVEEIEALKKEGVSNRVVNYMMGTGK
jgi:uncharacterized membrane protein